jgi:hypothetical protein
VLVEKGPAVGSSRAFAARLGIESDLVWAREMPRGQLADYYLAADACLGQFGRPVLTYSTIEPLAHGTPTASYIDDGTRRVPFYSTLPPVCNSLDPERVAAFLRDAAVDHGAMRRASWEWVNANCSESAFVNAFVDRVGRVGEATAWGS